jgi:hypothetical protein
LTSWLSHGAQPHAPIKHEFGKSPVWPQHKPVVTVPPEFTQSSSASPEGDGLGETVGDAEGLGLGVGCASRTHPVTSSAMNAIAASKISFFTQSPII